MGQVIRRDAAAEAIFDDGRTSRTNAATRGGRWQDLAEQRLASALALVDSVESQIKAIETVLVPLRAQIQFQNEKADKSLGKQYDIIWNEVGRPAHDAALSLLFPDGTSYYADGDTSEQPDRMQVLIKLLGTGLHPKLSKATADACAAEIAQEAADLKAAVDAARAPAAEAKILGRVRTALAKVVHSELANLKRLYKAEGFSEAEIHTVIPDRPTKSSK